MSGRAELKAARTARGWTQADAARALRNLVAERGLRLVCPAPLRELFSAWERGRRVVSVTFRDLLCELYETSAADLGISGEWAANYPSVSWSDVEAGRAPRSPYTPGDAQLVTADDPQFGFLFEGVAA